MSRVMNQVGSAGRRNLLVFDGDCGFCSQVVQRLMRSAPGTISARPWQETDLVAHGIGEARARREMLWVAGDGHLRGGALAFAAFFREIGGVWRGVDVLLRVPPTRWVAALVYRLVADNRGRLPYGSGACTLPAAKR